MFKMTTLNLPSWPYFRPGLGGTALFLAGLKRFAIDGPPEFLGDDETIGCWIDLGDLEFVNMVLLYVSLLY